MEFKENYHYGGWPNCLYLTNGDIELIATTDVGPRIIRFGFSGKVNLFKEFKEHMGISKGNDYLFYGGTRLWHAPQANPRSFHPDNFPVKYEWNNNKISLMQDIEVSTGVQKEIIISMHPGKNKVTVIYRIHNKALWGIKLAPWAISMMNIKGKAIVPQEKYIDCSKKLTPIRSLALWGYTNMEDPRWVWGKKYIQCLQDPNRKTCQKIGILNTQGWAAYNLSDYTFIKRYGFNQNSNYTDFGVNTELYTDQNVLEIETLGEYKEISPGDFAEHTECWYLFNKRVGKNERSIDRNLIPLLNTAKY